MTTLTRTDFAAMVDHTILTPTATSSDVIRICTEAIEFNTKTVCVNPAWVPVAKEQLSGSGVDVCCVAGFPLGADAAEAVAASARIALEEGAAEIDTVIPLGHLIGGDTSAVSRYLAVVRAATKGALLKVIIESATLTAEQIVAACELSKEAGADFVKTSTGFHPTGGASAEAVQIMRSTVGPKVGVKASGGIRTLVDVETMIAAGANRLGMSATAAVITELG